MARGQLAKYNYFANDHIDIHGAIEGFLDFCRVKNLSENTIIYYNYRLTAFQRYLKEIAPEAILADVTPQMLRGFIVQQTQINSASTANHSIITLRTFFNYLVKEGFLDTSPTAGISKVKRRKTIIETFSIEQIEGMLKTCGHDFTGVRDKAILLTLFDCGIRASELGTIKLSDVSWTDQTILIIGKGDKERVVPFGKATRQALSAYVIHRGELPSDRLFVTCYGEEIYRNRLAQIVTKRAKAAKITGVRCSPHTFRHTFAVSYLRAGGDVFTLQKILGHSDLSMTRRYVEVSQTDVQEKHRMYSPGDRIQLAGQSIHRTRLK
ncbi:MAG: tyrosine-type recombinase/integrase [Armatimonadota bacterium]